MANRLTCFLPFVFGVRRKSMEDQEQQQAQATPEKEIEIYK